MISDDYLENMSLLKRYKGLTNLFVNGTYDYLLMLDKDRLIGVTAFGKSSTKGYENDGEISAIYLREEYIGKGYGHSLLEKAEQALQDKGYTYLVLDVLVNNIRAYKFYLNHGYMKVADNTIRLGETEYPIAILRK